VAPARSVSILAAVEAVIAARCSDGAGGVEGGIEAGVIAEQPVVPPFAMMSWPELPTLDGGSRH
jgi:hypothetical protein